MSGGHFMSFFLQVAQVMHFFGCNIVMNTLMRLCVIHFVEPDVFDVALCAAAESNFMSD